MSTFFRPDRIGNGPGLQCLLALVLGFGFSVGCSQVSQSQPPLNRTPPPAVTQQTQPPLQQQQATCAVCGMPVTDDCENRFLTSLPDRKFVGLCSAICSASFVTKNPAALDDLEVVDYQTKKLVPAQTAWYLIDSKLEVVGAMPPQVAAFGAKADAEKAQQAQGGKVLDWKSLVETLRKRPEFQAH